jgi:hypothetical protein
MSDAASSAIGRDLAGLLGWQSASGPLSAFDFVHPDATRVIELKLGHQGVRDLHASVVKAALQVAGRPSLSRAVLVADLPRMSRSRVVDEWAQLGAVLKADVVGRVALVARASDDWVVLPGRDAELDAIAAAARESLPARAEERAPPRSRSGWTAPRQEVWKALLDAWLKNEPPVALGDLAARSGCSLPTVTQTLALLDGLSEVRRSRNRAVALCALPRRSLQEVRAAARHTREAGRYDDASGRPADVARLLSRLERLAPENVALGGVVAARALDPDFDLNGLPRLDLLVLPGDPLVWLRKLDPALEPQPAGHPSQPLLVLHRVARVAPRGSAGSAHRLPLASPAETLLDLLELGLEEQAEAFVRALKKKASSHV